MKRNVIKTLALVTAAMPVVAQAGTTKYTNSISSVNAPSASGSGTVNANTSSKFKSSVQNAVDSAVSNNKKTAKMGSGTWKFGGALKVKSDVNIYGNGSSNTLVRRNGGSNTGSFTTGLLYKAGSDDGVEDIEIRNMKLDGWYSLNYLDNSSSKLNCIYLSYSNDFNTINTRIRVRDCELKRSENGLLVGGARDITVMGTLVHEVGRSNLHHGWYSRRVGELLFQDSTLEDSLGGNGCKVSGQTKDFGSWESESIWNRNCDMSNNVRTGFMTGGNKLNRIWNGRFNGADDSNQGGIFLAYHNGTNNHCEDTDIYNCEIRFNDGDGIVAEYADDTWVDDNDIRSNDKGDFRLLSVTDFEDDE